MGRRRGSTGAPALLAALAVLVVLVLAASLVAGVLLLRDSEEDYDDLAGPPAAAPVAAPWEPLPAGPAAAESDVAAPSAAAVVQALQPLVADPALGSPGVVVLDGVTGQVLASSRAAAPAIPASTTKVVTAVAALQALGPDARLTTRVVRGAPGELVLVGGGDPTLTAAEPDPDEVGDPPARLSELAAAVVAADVGPVERIVVDASLFSGPETAAGWKPSYITSGNVGPVTALSLDGGRVDPDRRAREADPAAVAGARLGLLLEAAGVPGAKEVVAGTAPADAVPVAEVRSPPVSALVERMLLESDNDLAEALARHVALAAGLPGDFTSAGRALRDTAAAAGVPVEGVTLADGSGLSRDNRLTAGTVAGLLRLATERDDLRAVLTGLPVGGWSGTLAERYGETGSRGDPLVATAAGEVRAKTGTLDGVSSLAGVTVDADGRLLVFAVLADGVPPGSTAAAERALDRVAATLAACGCG